MAPFLASFPDVRMEIVRLVAEGDRWSGASRARPRTRASGAVTPATGRRFENVDEVYFFSFEDGRIAGAWGLEDTLDRMRQLGLAEPS